jgi:hypothetical protein
MLWNPGGLSERIQPSGGRSANTSMGHGRGITTWPLALVKWKCSDWDLCMELMLYVMVWIWNVPQMPIVQSLVPSLALLRGGRNLKKRGLLGDFRPLVVFLWRVCGTPGSSFPPFWYPSYGVSSFALPGSLILCCFTSGPRVIGSTNPEPNQNCEPKWVFPLYKLIVLDICYRNGKLINVPYKDDKRLAFVWWLAIVQSSGKYPLLFSQSSR